jgi:hypothetical protein
MRKFINKVTALVLGSAIVFNPLLLSINANAALASSPTWYNQTTAGVAPAWHYRVPVTASGVTVNSTVKVDVDFAALLTQLGISGTFDTNSPRVVRSNGSLSTIQEFTPSIYAGATNTTTTRGEVRFIAEDTSTYYIYFDVTQNGTKPVNPQTPIDGNFEKGTTGQATPPGWNAPTLGNTSFDAQVRPSESVSVTTNTSTTNLTSTTDGTPYTGNYSYLIGSRTNNEPNNYTGTGATITKTITVPSTNPGSLTFRYRIEGWDSNVNGNTTQYDYFQASLGSTVMVGPSLNNYTTLPFSPDYGTAAATLTSSGYGIYNGFDTDTRGTHHNGMTIAQGAQPWFTVTQSLAAFAGQTVTLTFTTHHTFLYKTWVSVDDVEWSVVAGVLGTPQGFGVKVLTPTTTTSIQAGNVVSISAQADSTVATYLVANIYNDSGTLVASNIRLYNDGTHGSNASTPSFWYNNGTDASNPTYTIPSTAVASTAWKIRVFARDGSSTTLGVVNGDVHISGQATTENSTDYFNIDENNFQITGLASFTNIKTVSILQDPIDGTTNPKAIPGADVVYNIVITNTGSGVADANTIVVTDPVPTNTMIYVKDFGATGSGPVSFTDGSTSSGLTYSFVALGSASSNLSFSNNNGSTYTYTPVADANGFDANVTNIKINPQGTMNATTSGSSPSFTLQFRVRIK